MKDRVVREVDELRAIEETFEVARKAIAHQLATHVLGDDS